MSISRIAAGSGAALLVVGAVVVFKPSSKLSAESFVSAAFTNVAGVSVEGNKAEIDKLAACPALTAALAQTAAPGFTLAFAKADGTAVDTTEAVWTPEAGQALYVMDTPGICGAFVSTTGRVCEATGNANPKGQSYLPRCSDALEIPTSYTSGCWCGADDVFTTANTDKSLGPGDKVGATIAGAAIATETAGCVGADGKTRYCLKGETCVTAQNGCQKLVDGTLKTFKRVIQPIAWAIPKIEGYDDKKLAICKSTNLQKKKCVVTAATAQTPNMPQCLDV